MGNEPKAEREGAMLAAIAMRCADHWIDEGTIYANEDFDVWQNLVIELRRADLAGKVVNP